MKTNWAKKIDESETLMELLDNLNEAESALADEAEQRGIDWTDIAQIDTSSLPTFGGPEPSDTFGIYSWDEDSYLVLANDGSWTIVDRY
jgi:hypothetical protein